MRIFLSLVLAAMLPGAVMGQADQAKQILGMTQANWVAVRDFDGQDLVYFTHLETYRCAIARVDYAINGGKLDRWSLAPCDEPGALFAPLVEGHLPYTAFPPGSVARVTVRITYPDGSTETAAFDRTKILIP